MPSPRHLGLMPLVMLGTLSLAAASCGDEGPPDVDTTDTIDTTHDSGPQEPDAHTPDASTRDAFFPSDLTSTPELDTTDDLDPDTRGPIPDDAADAPEDTTTPGSPEGPLADPDFPHAGELLLLEALAFSRLPQGESGAQRTIEVGTSGVLAVTIRGDGTAPHYVYSAGLCDDAGVCTALRSRNRGDDLAWLPLRFDGEVEAGRYVLELRGPSATSHPSPHGVRVVLAPWVEEPAGPADRFGTLPLQSQSAHRGADLGHYRWYRFDAERAGLLRIFPNSQTDVLICDPEAWGGVWTMCEYQPQRAQHLRLHVTRPGPVHVLLRPSAAGQDHAFSAFFDPDPRAPLCPPGEHHDGALGCAPTGTCAPGHHDDGLGRCAPEGVCAPLFQLRADGRCEGWLAEGPFLGFFRAQDHVTLADGHVVVKSVLEPEDVDALTVRDPRDGRWRDGTPIATPQDVSLQLCPLSEARVLAVAVRHPFAAPGERVDWIYDIPSDSWTPLAPSGLDWRAIACVALDSGRTLVWDGFIAALFDPESGAWTEIDALPNRERPRGVTLSPGVVVSTMSRSSSQESDRGRLGLWSEATGVWTVSSQWPGVDSPSAWSELVVDGDGLVVFGGGSMSFRRGVYRYAPQTDTWIERSGIPQTGSMPSGVAHSGGEVFFAFIDEVGRMLSYDLAADTWRDLPALSAGRLFTNRFMTSLPDGTVIGLWRHPVRWHIGD